MSSCQLPASAVSSSECRSTAEVRKSRAGSWELGAGQLTAMNAIEVIHASKVYRRYGARRQFATLKSALLSRQPDPRPQAGRDVHRGARRVVHGAAPAAPSASSAATAPARARCSSWWPGSPSRRPGTVDRERADLGADRARRRVPPGDLRPRERLHQRHHARPDQAGDRPALRRDRRVRRARGVHRRAGQDLLVRACTCGWGSRWRSTSIPTCCSSTRCWRSATRASPTSASTSSPSSSAAARPSCS